MEHALLRGRDEHPVRIGANVIVGPHAHVNGVEVGEGAFIATGAALFPGARIGAGAEVRVNGVVHVNSALAEGAVVPIGWVAVGDPAEILSPDRHDAIWAIQRDLDFPGTVLGIERGSPAEQATRRYAELFGRHRDDTVVG
jgi:carbonic anhydrase/acetyltransferase-like protein (isoleucine patch superfamily)